jgi:ABC-type molybdate transport system substrate-binding protein
MRNLLLSMLIWSAAAPYAAAWDSPVPDVVLYCTPAMEPVLRDVAAHYTARSGIEVHVFVAPPDGLFGLIKHRARDDVVVGDTPTLQTLLAGGFLRPGSLVPLGQDPYVLVTSKDAGLPPGSTAALLVASRTTIVPDPTTAASFDGRAILHAADPAAPAPAVIGVADTRTVIATVQRDQHLLGLVNATEAGAPGLMKAATLQAPPASISGALVTNGQSAKAGDLLAFIAGPEGNTMLHLAGLEPRS